MATDGDIIASKLKSVDSEEAKWLVQLIDGGLSAAPHFTVEDPPSLEK